MSLLQEAGVEVFNRALIESIDEILEFVFGEYTTSIILKGLEAAGLTRRDIPEHPEVFRFLLGGCLPRFGEPAPLLLMTILECLSQKLSLSFNKERAYHFTNYLLELKEDFLNKNLRREEMSEVNG